jgi:hypothetical protein
VYPARAIVITTIPAPLLKTASVVEKLAPSAMIEIHMLGVLRGDAIGNALAIAYESMQAALVNIPRLRSAWKALKG